METIWHYVKKLQPTRICFRMFVNHCRMHAEKLRLTEICRAEKELITSRREDEKENRRLNMISTYLFCLTRKQSKRLVLMAALQAQEETTTYC